MNNNTTSQKTYEVDTKTKIKSRTMNKDTLKTAILEAKAEFLILKLSQNKSANTVKISTKRALVSDMNVDKIFTDEKRFQNRFNAFSEDSKNRIIRAVENGTFDWAKFDPIIVWRDAKQDKFFVLSGHSRLAAFKELSKPMLDFSVIPVKIFQGTEEQAIETALMSNTLATKETDVERAVYWAGRRKRCEIKSGLVAGLGAMNVCEKEIEIEVKEAEGKNANYILNLSYLNPSGFLIEQLNRLGIERDNENTNTLRTIANWVGEARRQNKEISNIQESEIAKFLLNGGYGNKAGQFKDKRTFNMRLNFSFEKWKSAGADQTKSLNLANSLSKTSLEQEFDARLESAKKELEEATREHEEKYNKYLQALIQGEINQARMDELMKPLVYNVKRASDEVTRIRAQKGEVMQAAKSQMTLFGTERNMLYGLELNNSNEGESLSELGDNSAVYDYLTNLILEKIKEKPLFWRKSWQGKKIGAAYNYVSKKKYSGVNSLVLNFIAPQIFEEKGYTEFSDAYLTFKQANELGGKIKKGAKSFPVYYFNIQYFQIIDEKLIKISKEKYDELLNADENRKDLKIIPFLKYYNVFNAVDVDGIDFPGTKIIKRNNVEQIASCEFILDAYSDKPSIGLSTDNTAFYEPVHDYIRMPKNEYFEQQQEYYSTLFHELAHSTGHPKRLDRDLSGKFGSKKYALEELVAEFTALFLSADAGIAYYTMNNSAAYIQGWNKKVEEMLKEDNKFIFKASAEAQKAHDYILGGKSVEDFYNENSTVIKPIDLDEKTKPKVQNDKVEDSKSKKNKKNSVEQLSLFGYLQPNKKQIETIEKMLAANRPDLSWDGKVGYYSNGTILIQVVWSFEPETKYDIHITKEGRILPPYNEIKFLYAHTLSLK